MHEIFMTILTKNYCSIFVKTDIKKLISQNFIHFKDEMGSFIFPTKLCAQKRVLMHS